ncbi:unnamed protein product, partial [Mesorhabditis belari]|uniref:VWFA domain-containing protein n=1 Tax=Mesorhabditis belari TaxID=2138241 RepID=A0AAF3EK81_9BILA
MSLFDKTNYVSELVHFVPCEPMRMDGASGLFSATSLEKLVLISSDLNQDQIISNYNLPNDSSYSTLILDKDVPKENISHYLEHNLPPAVTTTLPTGKRNEALKFFWTNSDFATEKIVMQAVASALYTSTDYIFTANAWVYEDLNTDLPLPVSFLDLDQFSLLMAGFNYSGGSDTVVQATNAIDDWDIQSAVVVVFTNSEQSLINQAGSMYGRKDRTVAFTSFTTVDLTPISNYVAELSAKAITNNVLKVCSQLGGISTTIKSTKGPTTPTETETTASTPTPTTTPPPICNALFVMDMSSLVTELGFAAEGYSVMIPAEDLFNTSSGYIFSANVYRYFNNGDPSPPTDFISNYKDFEKTVTNIDYQKGGQSRISDAVNTLNSWTPDDTTAIVLFTNSDQDLIDKAALDYKWTNHTLAVALGSQDMHNLGFETVPNDWDFLSAGLSTVCARLNNIAIPSTTPPTTTAPTTTYKSTPSTPTTTEPPGPPCPVLFVLDGSDLAKTQFDLEKTAVKTAVNYMFVTNDFTLGGNVWQFGKDTKTSTIPNTFLFDQPTFNNLLDSVAVTGGLDGVVEATARLNEWRTELAVIVLMTASLQPSVDAAANNYTQQWRTIAVPIDNTVNVANLGTASSFDAETLFETLLKKCHSMRSWTTAVPTVSIATPSTSVSTATPKTTSSTPHSSTNVPTEGSSVEPSKTTGSASVPTTTKPTTSPTSVPTKPTTSQIKNTGSTTIKIEPSTTTGIPVTEGSSSNPITEPTKPSTSTTGLPTSSSSAPTSTSPPTTTSNMNPICKAIFVLDGSDKADFLDQKISVTRAASQLFGAIDLNFLGAIWEYGDATQDPPLANIQFTSSNNTFEAYLETIQNFVGGKEYVNEAATKLNDLKLGDENVLVFFTNSDQVTIDQTVALYKQKKFTVGVGIDEQDLTGLAAITAEMISKNEISNAIRTLCLKQLTTKSPTTTAPTSTPTTTTTLLQSSTNGQITTVSQTGSTLPFTTSLPITAPTMSTTVPLTAGTSPTIGSTMEPTPQRATSPSTGTSPESVSSTVSGPGSTMSSSKMPTTSNIPTVPNTGSTVTFSTPSTAPTTSGNPKSTASTQQPTSVTTEPVASGSTSAFNPPTTTAFIPTSAVTGPSGSTTTGSTVSVASTTEGPTLSTMSGGSTRPASSTMPTFGTTPTEKPLPTSTVPPVTEPIGGSSTGSPPSGSTTTGSTVSVVSTTEGPTSSSMPGGSTGPASSTATFGTTPTEKPLPTSTVPPVTEPVGGSSTGSPSSTPMASSSQGPSESPITTQRATSITSTMPQSTSGGQTATVTTATTVTSEPVTTHTSGTNPSQSTSYVPPGSSTAANTDFSTSVASSQPAPTSSPTPNLPLCQGLFVIDGSNQVASFTAERTRIRLASVQAYYKLDYLFYGNAWEYGNGPNDAPIPTTFIDSYSTFDDLLSNLDTYNGDENVTGAVEKLNAWTESNAIILLYTGSTQADVDQAAKIYLKMDSTLGISVDGKSDLSNLTAVTAGVTDLPAIVTALNYLCQSKLATVTGPSGSTTIGSSAASTTEGPAPSTMSGGSIGPASSTMPTFVTTATEKPLPTSTVPPVTEPIGGSSTGSPSSTPMAPSSQEPSESPITTQTATSITSTMPQSTSGGQTATAPTATTVTSQPVTTQTSGTNPSQATSYVPPGSSTAANTEPSTSAASSQPASTSFSTNAPSSTPSNVPICYGLFVFDGSNQVAGDEMIPTTFIETYDEIGDLILGLVPYNGNENVTGAVKQLNAWSENEAIIILYSASDQVDIDAAAKNYRKKTSTVGLSWQDKTDLSKLAAITVSPTDFDGIKVALNTLCQAKLSTTTGSTPETTSLGSTSENPATISSAASGSTTGSIPITSSTNLPTIPTEATTVTNTVASSTTNSNSQGSTVSTTIGTASHSPSNRPTTTYFEQPSSQPSSESTLGSSLPTPTSTPSITTTGGSSSAPITGSTTAAGTSPSSNQPTGSMTPTSTPSGSTNSRVTESSTTPGSVTETNAPSSNSPIPTLSSPTSVQTVTSSTVTTSESVTTSEAPTTVTVPTTTATEVETSSSVSLTTSTTTPIPIAKTLLVIDGSSLAGSIVSQRLFLQSLATVAFGRMDMIFSANIWEYGDDSQDEAIPITFIDNPSDVDDAIAFQQSYGGKENIIGATDKLNDWPIFDGVIVLITASPDNLIDMVSYFKRNQTVAISTHDGVDMSAITDYPHTLSSSYADVLDDIRKVALNLPPSPTVPTGSTPTGPTIGSSTMNPSSIQQTSSTSMGPSPTSTISGTITTQSVTVPPTTSGEISSSITATNPNPTSTMNPTSHSETAPQTIGSISTGTPTSPSTGGVTTSVTASNSQGSTPGETATSSFTSTVSSTVEPITDSHASFSGSTVTLQSTSSGSTIASESTTSGSTLTPESTVSGSTAAETSTIAFSSLPTGPPTSSGSTTSGATLGSTGTYSTESVPRTESPSPTNTELTSTTTPIPPPCPVFFYIDGSAAKTVIGQQTDLIRKAAISMYQSHEWRFLSSIGAFGELTIGDPDPGTLYDNFPNFESALDSLDFTLPSGDDVTSAIDSMNDDSHFGNVLTILFVAASQPTIDGANANLYKDFTYGIAMIGNQDLTRLSYDSDDYTTDNGATLQQAINNFCANFPTIAPPETVTTETPSTMQTALNTSPSLGSTGSTQSQPTVSKITDSSSSTQAASSTRSATGSQSFTSSTQSGSSSMSSNPSEPTSSTDSAGSSSFGSTTGKPSSSSSSTAQTDSGSSLSSQASTSSASS